MRMEPELWMRFPRLGDSANSASTISCQLPMLADDRESASGLMAMFKKVNPPRGVWPMTI